MSNHASRKVSESPTQSGFYRWYALAVLTAIFSVHYVDRSVLSVVIEPIKHEFALSDTAMGLLAGLAHSAALSVMALPMGWLADRTNRVRLVSFVVMIWSGLTAMGAVANSYAALLLMRVGVGAAEAGGPPASVSIISSLFARKELPTAMGLYYLAMALGTGAIFLVGGWVAEHYGWRAVFLVAGVPGVLLGLLLLLTVREPPRSDAGVHEKPPGVMETARTIARNRPALLIMVAGAAAATAQSAAWTWLASFLIRLHSVSLAEAGLIVGLAAALGKGFGSAIAGPSTRWLSGDRPGDLWRFPAFALILTFPVGWFMVTVPGTTMAIALVMMLSVLMGCWSGQVVAILMTASPTRVQGSSMSLYSLASNLIGAGLGPLFAGLLSDFLGGNRAVGQAIGWSMAFNLVAALFFFLACRSLGAREAQC